MKYKSLASTLLLLFLLAHGEQLWATDMNRAANCVVVPLARFNDSGETTAVGLTSQADTGAIRWIFYDQDGGLLGTGSMAVSQSHYNAFVMSGGVGANLAGEIGFLLFCLDSNGDGKMGSNDNPGLSANAFQIELSEQDVAYIPTIPVFRSDIDTNSLDMEIEQWTKAPLASLSVGADIGDLIELQYLVDGVIGVGEKTTFYLFSVDAPNDPGTMRFLGASGQSTNLPIGLDRQYLNLISVESIVGILGTSAIGAGLAYWSVDNSANDSFAFSIVKSPNFGATQTLLGNIISGE